jgi:DNA-binding PadR family transcriptional regulator
MPAGWPGRRAFALAMMEGGERHGKGRGRGRHEHFERFAEMRGPGGPIPYGPGPFGPGGGPFGGGRGRKRRGDVRLAVMLLLAEAPRNGYQLMQTIEERSEGRWRPSPGSVYPALSQLEDEGYVRAVPQGDGRVFELTDAGRTHLEERGDVRAPWEPTEDHDPSRFHALRSLVVGIGRAAWQVANEGDDNQWAEADKTLSEARRTLYRILSEEPTDDAESADSEA